MPPTTRSLDRLAVGLMLLFCASWGIQQVFAKMALAEVPALMQATIRSLGASVIVALYALWRERGIFSVRDRTLGLGLFCGLLFGLEFIAIYVGLDLTSASHVVLFVYTAPFFVALGLPYLVPSEGLTRVQWAGMVLSFTGVALALRVSGAASWTIPAGDLLALLGGIFWALTTILIKATRLAPLPATKILLYQLAASVPILAVFAVLRGEAWPIHLSGMSLFALIYQTVWVAALTYLGWFWLIRRYRATELSAFTFLTPVIGILAGNLILGDPLGGQFLLAAALVAAGLVLVNWRGVGKA